MKEKILEELNRRYDEYHAKYKETCDHYYEGKADALDLFIGFERETDASLKARAHSQLSLGQSTVESVAGALLNIEGVMDVKIYNNNTSSSISAKDTTGVAAHNVYIIIRKRNDITIADQDIGTAIHDVLIPGIRTTQAVADGHSYTYVESVDSIATLYYPNQVIYWKQTQGTTLGGVTIDVEPTAYFMQGELDAVAVKIMQWLNGLPIGTTLRELDCSAKMTELDPRPKGNPSYSFIQVTSLVQDNPDRYYEFTQYNIVYDSITGYYNIQLS